MPLQPFGMAGARRAASPAPPRTAAHIQHFCHGAAPRPPRPLPLRPPPPGPPPLLPRARAAGRGRASAPRPGSGYLSAPAPRPPVNLRDVISEYPDFPKSGVLFRDFGPLLADPQAVSLALDEIERRFHHRSFDAVAGIDARGFVVAAAAAVRYGKGMVMIRKAGKLPGRTVRESYEIEYGSER